MKAGANIRKDLKNYLTLRLVRVTYSVRMFTGW